MIRRALTTFGLALATSSCGKPVLPALGPVDIQVLCNHKKRCEAKGDDAVNLLKGFKPRVVKLAPGKGPEHFLGKVAPGRKTLAALKTCSGEVKPDAWFSSAESSREIHLGSPGQHAFREALRAHLQIVVGKAPETEQLGDELGRLIELSVRRVGVDKVSMFSQTHWLTDAALEERIGLCGEEEAQNIVYSITVLRLSKVFTRDLSSRLQKALEAAVLHRREEAKAKAPSPSLADAGAADAGDSDAAATQESSDSAEDPAEPQDPPVVLDGLTRRVVESFEQDMRFVIALGFDNP